MLFYLNSESLMVTCLSTYIVIWMQKQLVISNQISEHGKDKENRL